jgi:hypothetical protein
MLQQEDYEERRPLCLLFFSRDDEEARLRNF